MRQPKGRCVIRTNKASGLPARNTNNNKVPKGLDSNPNFLRAREDFATAGKYTMQGWLNLFTAWEESGVTVNAWATFHDGTVMGDLTLNRETVNKYFGAIKWAMATLADDMEDVDADEVTVHDVCSSFSFVTEIIALKKSGAKPQAKKKSDPVAREINALRKMTATQRKRFFAEAKAAGLI